MTTERVTIEPCPCGHKACTKVYLSITQDGRFTAEEGIRIARILNSHDDVLAACKALADDHEFGACGTMRQDHLFAAREAIARSES